jgi:hypothetical protein
LVCRGRQSELLVPTIHQLFSFAGAGGTAHAACYSLVQLGASFSIFNRSEERAKTLASKFSGASVCTSLESLQHVDIVIGTVPPSASYPLNCVSHFHMLHDGAFDQQLPESLCQITLSNRNQSSLSWSTTQEILLLQSKPDRTSALSSKVLRFFLSKVSGSTRFSPPVLMLLERRLFKHSSRAILEELSRKTSRTRSAIPRWRGEERASQIFSFVHIYEEIIIISLKYGGQTEDLNLQMQVVFPKIIVSMFNFTIRLCTFYIFEGFHKHETVH